MLFTSRLSTQDPSIPSFVDEQSPAVSSEPLALTAASAGSKDIQPIPVIYAESIEAELNWSDAEADFAVDVIVAQTSAESADSSYSTDFSPDRIAEGYVERSSFSEDIFSSSLATLYPDALKFGM